MAFSGCVGGVRFLCDVFGDFGKSMYVVRVEPYYHGFDPITVTVIK